MKYILHTERGRSVAAAMALTGVSAAFLFCGYEFIRSSVESIFIERFGAHAKPYALSCVPVMMAVLIYGYGRLLSSLGSAMAMTVSMLFSSAVFAVSYFFIESAGKHFVFLLYVFKESYVVVLAEQYWSFINSTLKEDEGKVFNGPVAGLGALGPFIGGYILSRYAVAFHTESFILLSALIILPAYAFLRFAYKKAGEPKPSVGEAGGKKGHLHLSILKENKTILFIALVIFATQVVSTVLDLKFTELVQKAMPVKDERTAYLGGFWMKVNGFSFAMQFLLTPLILKRVSIRFIQTAIPLVHLFNCFFLLINPVLGIASTAFLMFKGLDYSIFRASKELLYIPFSYDTRYRAKQVAEAFTYRFSKGFTALIISFLKTAVVLPSGFYPVVGIAASSIWSFLAFPLTAKKT
ncbi:MAG: hypothetical protein HY746_10500 [Elusimicrobia bacterium]|nr:hypothetical protein [Elusimicrobiota bacterium]